MRELFIGVVSSIIGAMIYAPINAMMQKHRERINAFFKFLFVIIIYVLKYGVPVAILVYTYRNTDKITKDFVYIVGGNMLAIAINLALDISAYLRKQIDRSMRMHYDMLRVVETMKETIEAGNMVGAVSQLVALQSLQTKLNRSFLETLHAHNMELKISDDLLKAFQSFDDRFPANSSETKPS